MRSRSSILFLGLYDILWFASDALQELEKSKPVVLTGDLNCAHEEIDIYNPAVSSNSFDNLILFRVQLVVSNYTKNILYNHFWLLFLKGNKRSAGFTDEERQSFETNFLKRGFVDTFRKQHPGVVGYTYWGYRHGGRKTNKGFDAFPSRVSFTLFYILIWFIYIWTHITVHTREQH